MLEYLLKVAFVLVDASLLFDSCRRGQYEIARILLDYGANPNAVKDQGTTPLHIASERGHHDIAQLLVDGGADATKVKACGTSAVFIAALQGFPKVVQVLVRAGSDIEQPNKSGHTPLMMAARKGQACSRIEFVIPITMSITI